MVGGWKHWCPNGCGKSAQDSKDWIAKRYVCTRCHGRFTKEEIANGTTSVDQEVTCIRTPTKQSEEA